MNLSARRGLAAGPETRKPSSGARLRALFAMLNTVSFVAMIWRFSHGAGILSDNLSFHWVMMTYMLGGCILPLTLIGSVALINALFWNYDVSESAY